MFVVLACRITPVIVVASCNIDLQGKLHCLPCRKFYLTVSCFSKVRGGRAGFSALGLWSTVTVATWPLRGSFLSEKRFPQQNLFFPERAQLHTQGRANGTGTSLLSSSTQRRYSGLMRAWSNSATCHRGGALAAVRKKRIFRDFVLAKNDGLVYVMWFLVSWTRYSSQSPAKFHLVAYLAGCRRRSDGESHS